MAGQGGSSRCKTINGSSAVKEPFRTTLNPGSAAVAEILVNAL